MDAPPMSLEASPDDATAPTLRSREKTINIATKRIFFILILLSLDRCVLHFSAWLTRSHFAAARGILHRFNVGLVP